MSGTGHTTKPVSATGDARIDGILYGTAWGDATISYSLPKTAAEYGIFYGLGEHNGAFKVSSAMAEVIGFALTTRGSAADGFSVEGFTNLDIERTDGSGAHIRLAQTTRDPYFTGSAWSYFPSAAVTGGDVWYSNRYSDYSAPVTGDYAHLTIIHEIGHALGLFHGHETSGSFGKLPLAYDTMEYSLMTYRSYVGADVSGGYTNETYGYAQSWMMLDIAALQHMYGADYTTNAGDTVYTWTPEAGITWVNGAAAISPGDNRIFATIWDGGGIDTYDLSAYSHDLQINLAPGGHSVFSGDQLAGLGLGKTARGNIFNALLYEGDRRSLIENAKGGSGNDIIRGNAADNRLEGKAGNDRLFGFIGADKLQGGDGNDILRGGAGKDLLIGGDGKDILFGGGGADVFRFSKISDSTPNRRADHIRDFTSGRDQIDLSELIPGEFSLQMGGRFSGDGASVIVRTSGDDLLVRVDANGDGKVDFGIVLDDIDTVLGRDFLL
ncbi:MAG: M10 family metallopeptidase [Pseudodonghicola sp.]